ncbi:Protein-tyrosine sulfotransferase 2 [Plecturocebus cupreus]
MLMCQAAPQVDPADLMDHVEYHYHKAMPLIFMGRQPGVHALHGHVQGHYCEVTTAGFNLSSYGNGLTKWNKATEMMYAQCMEVGKDKYLPVYYTQLVLQPRSSLKLILYHLGITWSNTVLHHQVLIGKRGGIFLFKIQRSMDQVIKPVNLEVLSK